MSAETAPTWHTLLLPQSRSSRHSSCAPAGQIFHVLIFGTLKIPHVSRLCTNVYIYQKGQHEHTWNIFFSAPLCFMYSLGRNSFRLEKKGKIRSWNSWKKSELSFCCFLFCLFLAKRKKNLIFYTFVHRRHDTDAYSKNPGLCLCSMWGPNWIWAWIPPNSQALSNDTGWEPFRMSSRA